MSGHDLFSSARKAAVLLCAGQSTRMGFDKLTRPIRGMTAIERSLDALVRGGADEIVCAVSELTRAHAEKLKAECALPMTIVEGGQTRGESVLATLRATQADVVAIHDAARCFVTPAIVRACLESAIRYGSGVAAIPVTDTTLLCEGARIEALPREKLRRTQTPQAFRRAQILGAYERAFAAGQSATDDATLFAAAGNKVRFVTGSPDNVKLTTPEDMAAAGAAPARIGWGEDMHRLCPDRKLILGGVEIPFQLGLLGHSDADVLTHALIDALLGAINAGDIGRQFPDTDERYRGISSLLLLDRTMELVHEAGFVPLHADMTVVAQKPKLAPYIPAMRERLADAMRVDESAVSVKATTTEGLGPEGRMEGIRATAVVLLAPA